jgi:hypothetical protein
MDGKIESFLDLLRTAKLARRFTKSMTDTGRMSQQFFRRLGCFHLNFCTVVKRISGAVRKAPRALKVLRILWNQRTVFLHQTLVVTVWMVCPSHFSIIVVLNICQWLWPRGLSRRTWSLGYWLWVQIPLKAWMFVPVFLCCIVLCR